MKGPGMLFANNLSLVNKLNRKNDSQGSAENSSRKCSPRAIDSIDTQSNLNMADLLNKDSKMHEGTIRYSSTFIQKRKKFTTNNYKTVINGMREEGKNVERMAKKLQLQKRLTDAIDYTNE